MPKRSANITLTTAATKLQDIWTVEAEVNEVENDTSTMLSVVEFAAAAVAPFRLNVNESRLVSGQLRRRFVRPEALARPARFRHLSNFLVPII